MTKMLSNMSDVKSQENVPNNASGTRKTDSGGKTIASCPQNKRYLKAQ